MALHHLDADGRYSCLYQATVEHFRNSFGLDGHERLRLQQEPLDGVAVRRIAKEYKFIQWIPRDKGQHADVNADGVAQIVNQALPNWPQGLDARSAFCAARANQALGAKYTVNPLMSGMTKLLWFVRPDGWTIYDRFAATGLGLGNADAITKATHFYDNLNRRGFDEFAAEINGTLTQHGFDTLFGERIIDKLLMLAGGAGQGVQPFIEGIEMFPEFVPEAFRESVQSVCQEVAETFADHAFFAAP